MRRWKKLQMSINPPSLDILNSCNAGITSNPVITFPDVMVPGYYVQFH